MTFPEALDIVKNRLREKETVSDKDILDLVDGDKDLQRIIIDTLQHQEFAEYDGRSGIRATGKDEPPDNLAYDVFISYSRNNNTQGHIDYIVNDMVKRYKHSTDLTLQVFFDRGAIKTGELWKEKINNAIRHSRVFMAALSPDYIASDICRLEWQEFVEHQQSWHRENTHMMTGHDSIIVPYVIKTPALMEVPENQLDVWGQDIRKRNLLDLCDWYAGGKDSLATAANINGHKHKFSELAEKCRMKLEEAERYKRIPDNIPPFFKEHLPRTDIMQQVRHKLHSSNVVGLWGFAGMGKSTAAFSYAREYKMEYKGGCWYFPAEGMQSIPELIASKLPDKWAIEFSKEEKKDEKLKWRRIREYMEQPHLHNSQRRTLLIFDNTENAETTFSDNAIREYLPRGVDVLVTKREQVSGMRLSNWDIKVEPLSEKESMALLRHYMLFNKPGDEEAAAEICRLLGGYTLGLTIVGVHLSNMTRDGHPIGYAEVLHSLKEGGINFLDLAGLHSPSLTGGYERVGREISKLLELLLKNLSDKELLALDYAALLPPDSIALPWLEELLKNAYPNNFAPAAYIGLPSDWQKLVAHLKRLALITGTEEPNIVRMHRVFADVLRRRMENKEKKWEEILEIARRDAHASWNSWHEADKNWQIPMLQELARYMIAENTVDIEYLNWIAELQRLLGDYKNALYLVEQAIVKNDDETSRLLKTSYTTKALILGELGDYSAARDFQLKAVAIMGKYYSDDFINLAINYSNLATILQDLGDYEEAKEWMEKAIKIQEEHFEPDHPILAVYYSNLALILRDLGDYKGAKDWIEKTIAIKIKNYEPNHPTFAISYLNLASILYDLGEYEQALPAIEKAKAIAEQHFHNEHPTCININNWHEDIKKALGI